MAAQLTGQGRAMKGGARVLAGSKWTLPAVTGSPSPLSPPVAHQLGPLTLWVAPMPVQTGLAVRFCPLAIQGQAPSPQTGALAAPGAPPGLSQALCVPDLQLLLAEEPEQAPEGRRQVLSWIFLSFQGAGMGLESTPALLRGTPPCRLQAEVARGHRHSEARR